MQDLVNLREAPDTRPPPPLAGSGLPTLPGPLSMPVRLALSCRSLTGMGGSHGAQWRKHCTQSGKVLWRQHQNG